MAGYQSFSLNAVEEAQDSSAAAYREFLRRPGFSMGMYLLPAGGQDAQHPHSADEVYTVQHGRAQLEVEGERFDVGPGDVISVDRGRDRSPQTVSRGAKPYGAQPYGPNSPRFRRKSGWASTTDTGTLCLASILSGAFMAR